MLGIYPSYFTHDKKEQVIISTQFESHHAREAFPCIDEPEAKAIFNLTIITNSDDEVLSNTMPLKQIKNNHQIKTIFKPTPIMSTYLLAFVVGQIHCVKGKTKSGVLVRSWASKARPKKELEYANKEAVDILEFFTDYFDTPYPLEKCDQVALPDFDSGAMENWGLITYREIALLTDPSNRSISSEQYVSLVIAHELSHQWFGNLVTMKWWDDLWLNESFASLMEHIALDNIHPDWQQWELFTSTDVINTSNRDVYKNIQPVSVEVEDPELISTLFDPAIVYAKGARLLKMIREYIGDEKFRIGLHDYFKKFAYKNTTSEDLWNSLEKSSQKPVLKIMMPWITQPGMPMLEVDQQGKQLKLNQKHFLINNENNSQIWSIPLLASQEISKDILAKKEASFTTSDDYILINQFGSGHYLTNYVNPDHREYLANHIINGSIPTEAKINMLNDGILLARQGSESLVDSIKLAYNLNKEERDSVWSQISRILSYSSQLTEGNKQTEDKIKQFKIYLAKNWYEKLGWNDDKNDSPNTKQLRHTALAFMLSGEDKIAIKKANQIYKACTNINKLPAETRASILSSVVKSSNSNIVANKLIKLYPDVSSEIQHDICIALSATKNKSFAKQMLNSALGANGFVRDQDIVRWLAIFLRSKYSKLITWDWIENNWQWLEDTLGESKSYDYMPVICASSVNNSELEKRYHKLFKPLLTNKALKRNIQIGFIDVATKVAWRKRDEKNIIDYFKSLQLN